MCASQHCFKTAVICVDYLICYITMWKAHVFTHASIFWSSVSQPVSVDSCESAEVSDESASSRSNQVCFNALKQNYFYQLHLIDLLVHAVVKAPNMKNSKILLFHMALILCGSVVSSLSVNLWSKLQLAFAILIHHSQMKAGVCMHWQLPETWVYFRQNKP